MSGVSRLLSRRVKPKEGNPEEKVQSPSLSMPSASSSVSSSHVFSGAATPLVLSHGCSSSSSFSSASTAFSFPALKASPHLQATHSTVHSSTANSSEHLLLQPKQTAGHLQGTLPDHEETLPKKNEEKKVEDLSQKLAKIGIRNFQAGDIEFVLNGAYAKGNSKKAYDLLLLLEQSEKGDVKAYNPSVELLGAVNRKDHTCYLDSILFAMFARLKSFEPLLHKDFDDEPRKRLVVLLRLWVNALRSGKLISVDITKQLQEALANCGWEEATDDSQQDASEAFAFITDKLDLPLLNLKMDIFHSGKEDTGDDHKYVTERLLEVAIPEDPGDNAPIPLEDCLEAYFNNRIEVKRLLERKSTVNSSRSRRSLDSLKTQVWHVESVETAESQPTTPVSPVPLYSPLRSSITRARSPSIIQDRYPAEKERFLKDCLGEDEYERGSKRLGSIKKDVNIPAWQFFNLCPWSTDTPAKNNDDVAALFRSQQRPVLGICLKRYTYTKDNIAIRRSTRISVPLENAIPHFVNDDPNSDDDSIVNNFKLSLQSVVCHRGDRVDSGHYISLVRGQASNLESANGGSSTDDLPQDRWVSPQDRWLRFDDLASPRVSDVDIHKALEEESPYLLFYQVQPIDEGVTLERESPPPSYVESSTDSKDSGITGSSEKGDKTDKDLKESITTTENTSKLSLEVPRSEGYRGRLSTNSDRPSSISFTETSVSSSRGLTTESAAGSRLPSRRNSKSSRTLSTRRARSVGTDKRLSGSFSRFAAMLAREPFEKATTEGSGDDDSSLVVVEPMSVPAPLSSTSSSHTASGGGPNSSNGSAGPAIPPVVVESTDGVDHKRNGRDGRDKTRNRMSVAFGKGKEKDKEKEKEKTKGKNSKPDRECRIM